MSPIEPNSRVLDGLARPIDFGAGYGEGLKLGLSLGGGGIFFVAWQVAYLHELALQGVHLRDAQRVVGTSAGSVVASILEAGHLNRFQRELGFFARTPALVSLLAPAGDFSASQQHAVDLFTAAHESSPETIRAIGHAALAASAPSANKMARSVSLMLLSQRWPSAALNITCVDTHTGERCVVDSNAGVPINRAVAASSAVPGVFAPQPIGDRRCMDGGVSGTGTHLDLFGGAQRVVVLSLVDGTAEVGGMTSKPGAFVEEVAALEATGTKVFARNPESVDLTRLMDPASVPQAIAMGGRQAKADAQDIREFLS